MSASLERTDSDEVARLDALERIEKWSDADRNDVTIVVFGSVVRGDYTRGSDQDLMIFADTPPVASACVTSAVAALQDIGEAPWSNTYVGLAAVLATPAAQRTCANQYAIQFGAHGFDTFGHHRVLKGRYDLLRAGRPPLGDDLIALSAERLRFNKSTSGDAWAKRAIESIKAAVVLASVRTGRAPTRHCELIPLRFESLVPPFSGKEIWHWIWADYRCRRRVPTVPDAIMRSFVDALASAMGV